MVNEDFVPSDEDEISDSREECVFSCNCGISCFDRKKMLQFIRERKDENYEKHKRKRRRNLRTEYLASIKNKCVKPCEIGSPCKCQKKCREKINKTEDIIFTKFWDLESYDLQNSYLYGCIRVDKKKIFYKNKQNRQESSRKFTAKYTVNVDGQDVNISGVRKNSLSSRLCINL
ncbi:hypothetical protein ABEB36_014599 [Hypothenemus hampei]|uniref:Uncharacterized protein n=1 Tax=Hypothenemus hampei TaxID=57062 RepID=A0ABD1E2J9_HYPHA